jgi:hypothetical protein
MVSDRAGAGNCSNGFGQGDVAPAPVANLQNHSVGKPARFVSIPVDDSGVTKKRVARQRGFPMDDGQLSAPPKIVAKPLTHATFQPAGYRRMDGCITAGLRYSSQSAGHVSQKFQVCAAGNLHRGHFKGIPNPHLLYRIYAQRDSVPNTGRLVVNVGGFPYGFVTIRPPNVRPESRLGTQDLSANFIDGERGYPYKRRIPTDDPVFEPPANLYPATEDRRTQK